MQLDKRFKVLPFCCFGTDKKAITNHIGKKGYFANDIDLFKSIDLCEYGTLEKIYCDKAKSFQMREQLTSFRFFIPEYFVEPKEKQYRPFKDTKEFFIKTNFEEGDLIHIRSKNKIEYWLMLVGWTNNRIKLGTDDFTFENLFENFELWDGEENFIPFGVEVEE